MNSRQPLFALAVSTLGFFILPSAARAFGVSYVNSTRAYTNDDNAFNALNPNLAFVAEGRIGSNTIGGNTYELDFHGTNPSNPTQTSAQGEFKWSNGGATAFSLSYDALTKAIVYTVGNVILKSVANSNPVTDIFIRTRAVNANTSILANNLLLNGIAVPGSSLAASAGDGIEYLRLSGLNPLKNFSLTGESIMSWSGAAPTQSRLAYQIKVGTALAGSDAVTQVSEAVPEPTTMLGLAVGGASLAAMRKRRSQKV